MKTILASLLSARFSACRWPGIEPAEARRRCNPPARTRGFGADGTISPLFCVVDNSLALRSYRAEAMA